MAAGVHYKAVMTGDKELHRLCAELPRRSVKNSLRKAVNLGANPVVAQVKARAPKESGALKRSAAKKIKTYADRKGGAVIAIIGANKRTVGTWKRRKRVPHKYSHLVDQGTRHSRAQPHLAPALAAAKGASTQIMQDKLREELVKEAKRLGRP